MLFDEKKIDIVSIDQLVQIPIDSVKPFTLMLSPIYVLMKRNQKLVAVKAPLDFFTPEELNTLRVYGRFFAPQFVNAASRFRTSAKLVRSLLRPNSVNVLPPAPYEISNEVMQTLGSLWGKDYRIESFFAAIFTDELCGSLDPERMLQARETAVEKHDQGILLSGMLVFVLIHLGWFDFDLLRELRIETYNRTIAGETWSDPKHLWESINSDLMVHVLENIPLDRESMQLTNSEWARKVLGRLKRLEKIPSLKKYDSLTIFGPGGFAA
jgi:hypothetical protein